MGSSNSLLDITFIANNHCYVSTGQKNYTHPFKTVVSTFITRKDHE